eukprot:TRINITY_DN18869_c0_g1_i2.p1 TRINITY_DN18869_c0_g1~~TRINITY_DN18869_c0_g1_i2.p1  ORF type:complete len:112 (-),score=31.01 TRINITY_DN18869_c0_g1_i2:311-646(-)
MSQTQMQSSLEIRLDGRTLRLQLPVDGEELQMKFLDCLTGAMAGYIEDLPEHDAHVKNVSVFLSRVEKLREMSLKSSFNAAGDALRPITEGSEECEDAQETSFVSTCTSSA